MPGEISCKYAVSRFVLVLIRQIAKAVRHGKVNQQWSGSLFRTGTVRVSRLSINKDDPVWSHPTLQAAAEQNAQFKIGVRDTFSREIACYRGSLLLEHQSRCEFVGFHTLPLQENIADCPYIMNEVRERGPLH